MTSIGESDGWPLEKAKLRIASRTATEAERRVAILCSTGALSPIHHGHLEIFERARERLEKCNFFVAAAFASPSHDLYVRPKANRLGTVFFPAALRIKWTQQATEASDWISCGSWEASYVH